MVSHLLFYQWVLIALVWLFFMLHWMWPSAAATCPTTAEPTPPVPKAPSCAQTLCRPHHKASLRRLCTRQRPPRRGALPPAPAHRAHTGAPPPGRHLHARLPAPRLPLSGRGRLGQSPRPRPSPWGPLAPTAVHRL